ncbi:MAG: LamG domain-containing protein [Planctomyces sp.]|nr:LamG domain-containing protein [Planctomyces sp.]
MRKKSIVHWICCFTLCHTAVLHSNCTEAGDALSETSAATDAIAKSLIFHAPFDDSFDARVGKDKKLYTAASLERKSLVAGNDRPEVILLKDEGKYGGALRFQDNSEKVTLFQGVNSSYQQKNWSGTLSFWLKVDPDKGLKPGYCDPIQMTDKTWNDSSMFVDFDKDLPRTFRLGVFSEYRFWNPKDTAWEQITPEQRPMVVVQRPPFSSDQWTHIAWTFHNINPENNEKSNAVLYVNGVSQGELNAAMKFVWKPENAVIMLGIAYIGDFDDFSIFDRALTADEILTLMNLPQGAAQLKLDQ